MLGFSLFDNGRPRKPGKGAETYAQPPFEASFARDYLPDMRDKDYAIRQLDTLLRYASEQPGPLAIAPPAPQPRPGLPAGYKIALAVGAALVGLGIATGGYLGLAQLRNRQSAPAAPVVEALGQLATTPMLVAEPGFATPLAPQPTTAPVEAPPPVPRAYQPKGVMQRGDKTRGILIDCISDCDPAYLDEAIINAGKVVDTLQIIYGAEPYRGKQLVLEATGKNVRMALSPDLPYDGIIKFTLENDRLSVATACDEMSDFYIVNGFAAPLWLREGLSLYSRAFCINPHTEDFDYNAAHIINNHTYERLKSGESNYEDFGNLEAHGVGGNFFKGLSIDYHWRLPQVRAFLEEMRTLHKNGYDTTKPESMALAARNTTDEDITPLLDLLKPGIVFDSHGRGGAEDISRFLREHSEFGIKEVCVYSYPEQRTSNLCWR